MCTFSYGCDKVTLWHRLSASSIPCLWIILYCKIDRFSICRSSVRHFFWPILDSSSFPLFHSGQVFGKLVCPLTVDLPQSFISFMYLRVVCDMNKTSCFLNQVFSTRMKKKLFVGIQYYMCLCIICAVYLRLQMFTFLQHGRTEMLVNRAFNYESHNIRHFVVITATGRRRTDIDKCYGVLTEVLYAQWFGFWFCIFVVEFFHPEKF